MNKESFSDSWARIIYKHRTLIMFCSVIAGFTFGQMYAEDVPAPITEKEKDGMVVGKGSELAIKEQVLTKDEIIFVKDQFRLTVLNTALMNISQEEKDQTTGVILSIKHPKDNPFVKLVATEIFTNYEFLEKSISDNVYRETDMANKGYRQWSVNNEYIFISSKLKMFLEKDGFFEKLLKAYNEVKGIKK